MKDFMKYIMATVVGICLVGGVVGCLGVVTLIGIASANDAAPDIQDNSVLLLKLSGVMEERAEENPWSMLGGDMLSTQGLNETLTAIRKAKTNACVKGIYIEAGAFTTDFASLQEIRNALVDFNGVDVDVFVSHFGLAKAERANAVKIMAELIKDSEHPVIVMGDFNAQPNDPVLDPIRELLSDTFDVYPDQNAITFPTNPEFGPDQKIDYIFVSKEFKTESVEIINKQLSDHRAYVANVELNV